MTDRYAGVVVTFDHDIRSDDAEDLLKVLRSLRGVVDVTPHVADLSDHLARGRLNHKWKQRILQLVDEGV